MNTKVPHYIDGFVFPVLKEQLGTYSEVAEKVAAIYVEHGALDYQEFVGDDMQREGTLPFSHLMTVAKNEVIVFGWITFESREERDAVNRKVEADPRMADLVEPLMTPGSPVFDPKRMAYGGFRSLVGFHDRAPS